YLVLARRQGHQRDRDRRGGGERQHHAPQDARPRRAVDQRGLLERRRQGLELADVDQRVERQRERDIWNDQPEPRVDQSEPAEPDEVGQQRRVDRDHHAERDRPERERL